MREWQEAKREYEAVPVPPELGERVQAGIRQGLAARRRAAARRRWVRSAGAFAACFAVLFAGLNLSPTFASAAADMPVVGGLLRVLTVRSYTAQDQDRTLTVSQPAVSGGDEFTKKINAEIQKRVEEETARGEETVREYKEAFLSTGGTEAEWEQHDNRVSVTYSIKSETDTTVSFHRDHPDLHLRGGAGGRVLQPGRGRRPGADPGGRAGERLGGDLQRRDPKADRG
jgi:hypothetical protein